jgi:hypothetical protein
VIESPAHRYLRLGLRLGRHVDGIVDAYFGPAELAAAVDAEEPVEPATLVADAEALLDEVKAGWLRDQVVGLRTFAGVLAGESMSYADEVHGCYGVRPFFTDESVFMAAHERLEELLPGPGSLGERRERFNTSTLVPTDQIERTVAAVIKEARNQTSALVDLPAGEGIELEIVHDVPWLGFNFYRGDLRGRVAINVDLPMSAMALLLVAIHEAYPGHQTERAIKEHRLVRERGLIEETIVLVPTPQSLVTEGIGQLAPHILFDGGGADALAAIVRGAGVDFDLDRALAIERVAEPCRWVEVNAALMMHERGVDEAEVHAYLMRWGLVSAELASHLIRYLNQPDSRTYIMNYPVGFALCSSYAAGGPDRFTRLLTEQVRVAELLAAAGRTG